MKVSDIQIGDWLQNTNGNIGIVRSIYRYCDFEKNELYYEVVMEYAPNSTCYSSLSMLKPIPLTLEILEKNGFVLYPQDFTSNSVYKFGTDFIEYERDCGHFNIGPYVEYRHLCRTINYISSLIRIRYVHELQHALRLCGIEKEIVL